MSIEPRLEIEVTEKGVRAVRVFGDGWEQSQRALDAVESCPALGEGPGRGRQRRRPDHGP